MEQELRGSLVGLSRQLQCALEESFNQEQTTSADEFGFFLFGAAAVMIIAVFDINSSSLRLNVYKERAPTSTVTRKP